MAYNKQQLINNARILMKQSGGRIAVRGIGNKRHVHFYAADGRVCSVWFPVESRTNDLEITDIREAIATMSGYLRMHEYVGLGNTICNECGHSLNHPTHTHETR